MKTKVFLASVALVIVFALIAGWSPQVSAFSFLGLFLTVLVGVFIIEHE